MKHNHPQKIRGGFAMKRSILNGLTTVLLIFIFVGVALAEDRQVYAAQRKWQNRTAGSGWDGAA